MYQVSQHISKDKIFIVNKSDIDGRLDPKMALYNQSVQHALYPMVKLKSLLLSKPQYGANEASIIRDNNEQPRYVRITDIDENGLISLDELGATVANLDVKYILNENDIVIARSGATVGKSYIHKLLPYTCVYAGYLIRFVVDSDKILPNYLFAYTQLNPYKEWVNAIQRPSAQPNINAEEYQSLEIPLPNLSKQQEIVDFINEAYTQKRAKEVEAQQLLDSIDDYLLKELGIILPTKHVSSSIKNRIYIINLSTIERDRLDSDYFDNKYRILLDSVKEGTYPIHPLGDNNITSFISTGQTPKSDCYTEEETDFPIIKAGSYNGHEIDLGKVSYTTKKQSYSVQKGDIFILSAAHQAEYIAKQICYLNEVPRQNTSFVGELLCIRASVLVNSMYLYSLLSTQVYKTLLNREKRGQTSHLYAKDVSRVLIPLPPIEKQNEIAKHIEEIRLRAKVLQAEGKAILEDAKRKVEEMIIGL